MSLLWKALHTHVVCNCTATHRPPEKQLVVRSAPPPAKPSSARQALLGKPDLEAVLDPREKPDRRVRMASPVSLVLAAEKGLRGNVAPLLWGSLAFLGLWGPLARRETQEPLAHAEGRERKENEVAEARKAKPGKQASEGRKARRGNEGHEAGQDDMAP